MYFYAGGRHSNMFKWCTYFRTPIAVSEALLEEGGFHNDSTGVGSAWKNFPRSFSAQSPTPSSFSFYLLWGVGIIVFRPPPPPIVIFPPRDPLGLLVHA